MPRLQGTCEACGAPCPKRDLMCFGCWFLTPPQTRKELIKAFTMFRRKFPIREIRLQNLGSQEGMKWAKLAIAAIEMVNPEAESLLDFKEIVSSYE